MATWTLVHLVNCHPNHPPQSLDASSSRRCKQGSTAGSEGRECLIIRLPRPALKVREVDQIYVLLAAMNHQLGKPCPPNGLEVAH